MKTLSKSGTEENFFGPATPTANITPGGEESNAFPQEQAQNQGCVLTTSTHFCQEIPRSSIRQGKEKEERKRGREGGREKNPSRLENEKLSCLYS